MAVDSIPRMHASSAISGSIAEVGTSRGQTRLINRRTCI
jgi:hypothetical protein